MLAAMGYTMVKGTVLNIIDGGGFLEIVPSKVKGVYVSAKDAFGKFDIKEAISGLKKNVLTSFDGETIKVALAR